ncbi:hypothetical protein [Mycolicibacter minnesotensis]
MESRGQRLPAGGAAAAIDQQRTPLKAFAADLARNQDSPLSTGEPAWIDGTRVNQTE